MKCLETWWAGSTSYPDSLWPLAGRKAGQEEIFRWDWKNVRSLRIPFPSPGISRSLIPVIHGLRIYKFTCLLTFFVTFQSVSTLGTLLVIRSSMGRAQSSEKFESSDMRGPRWGQTRQALPACFRSQTVNKCPGWGLFTATLCVCLHFCAFHLVILLFRKPSAEVLSSVPKCKKAVTCLMEKVQVR